VGVSLVCFAGKEWEADRVWEGGEWGWVMGWNWEEGEGWKGVDAYPGSAIRRALAGG
jgi:hypothetical protein